MTKNFGVIFSLIVLVGAPMQSSASIGAKGCVLADTAIEEIFRQYESLIEIKAFSSAKLVMERLPVSCEGQRCYLEALHANRLEDWKRGVESGRKAVELLTGSSKAHLAYAVALRNKMRAVSWFTAMTVVRVYKKELESALSLDPSNIDARIERVGFLTNAPVMVGGGAKPSLQEILEIKKYDWREGMLAQTRLQLQFGDKSGARESYEDLLRKFPGDSETLCRYGELLQALGLSSDADRLFSKISATGEASDRFWALSLVQRGRQRAIEGASLGEALEFFDRCLESPACNSLTREEESELFLYYGIASQKLGRLGEARKLFEKALSTLPRNEKAARALKRLGSSR